MNYGGNPGGKLLGFLPARVIGRYVGGSLPNGDFAIAHDDLLRADLERIERVTPVQPDPARS